MPKALYDISQCALYKVGSKKRLASVLNTSAEVLLSLANNPRYRVFPILEQTCPFTGKVTKERWVQEPIGPLRAIHERLQSLLTRVIPPDYAHAAVKGRSYRSNAESHLNGIVVATFDIKKFYPSTAESSVYKFFFKKLKCAPDVAGILTNLVCYKHNSDTGKSGLPTGSPLSPILSIYANEPMFDALAAVAVKWQLKFTCYVDDLTFSGVVIPRGLPRIVNKIIEINGHRMAVGKTRFFGKNDAKHITGVVIKNSSVAVPFERFKKARQIERAIAAEPDLELKLKLTQKLAGLLGEAAYLDKQYAGWARNSYRTLADVKNRAQVIADAGL